VRGGGGGLTHQRTCGGNQCQQGERRHSQYTSFQGCQECAPFNLLTRP
jgi:hypothetical protein